MDGPPRVARIRIPTEDREIVGFLHLGRSPVTPTPAVLICHGLGGYKEEEHLVGVADALVSSGITALRFDATGIGESNGEHPEQFAMDTYRADIDALIGFLGRREGIDSSRLGIAGHSLGAMLAVIAASENPDVAAVAAISPPYRLDRSVGIAALLPDWRANGFTEKSNPHQGTYRIGIDFLDHPERWDAATSAARLDVPLLVVVGDEDDVVPPAESRQIARAARHVRWIELPEIDHRYKVHPREVERVSQHLAAFFIETFFGDPTDGGSTT